MPLKTILLQMGPDEQRLARLGVAARLAARHGACLEMLYLTAPAGMPAAIEGRGASYAYIDEVADIAREKADLIRAEAEAAARAAGVEWRWEIADGGITEVLAARSRSADLVVVSREYGLDDEGHVGLDRPDELIAEAACGVLVLPNGITADQSVGRRILLAWKDSRGAGRAARDALPFLVEADAVFVFAAGDAVPALQAAGLLGWLERHGVRAEVIRETGDDEVAQAILRHARDRSADMLVMGAYGHSWLRQAVLGSVTRDVLHVLPLPALLAH